jgi:hypothetical protein
VLNRSTVVAASASLLALALLQLPLPLGGSLWAQTFENAAHAPLFALLAAVLLVTRYTRPAASTPTLRGYAAIALTTVAIGAVTEIAQWFTGRDASWIDLGNDGLGAIAALAFMAWRRREPFVAAGTTRHAALLLALLALVPVALPLVFSAAAYWQRSAQLPLLWQVRSTPDRYFVSRHSNSIAIDEPYPDWRGYRELVIEIHNPGAQSVAVTVRVHDARHNNQFSDRYNRTFVLPPMQRTTLRMALTDIERAPDGRAMDMAHIAGVIVFADGATPESAFRLLVVRLE